MVPSKFLDLCSFVIAHRFSSQKWLDHLKEHISAVDTKWGSKVRRSRHPFSVLLFNTSEKVINLKTGEAMIFSPAALILGQAPQDENSSPDAARLETVAMLGQGYLTVRSRKRITMDGGRSVMATRASPYAQSMPIPVEACGSSSPKSIAESVQTQAFSIKTPIDIGKEPPIVPSHLRFADRFNLSSSIEFERLHSPLPSGILGVGKNSTPGISTDGAVQMQSAPGAAVRKEHITAKSSDSPTLAPSIGQEAAASTQAPRKPNSEIRFRHLISILKERARKNQPPRIPFSDLGVELKKIGNTPKYRKLGEYLKEAEQAKIVKIGNGSSASAWVELVE